ncbi:MAG: menaquinone biosynthesis protein [Acidobacteriaceae bacterium]
MSRLRVSAISFLNTVPLMYDFEHPPCREQLLQSFEVHYTLPSVCAEELRSGKSDIGIVPVAAYATIPDLFVIPGVAIAAKHPVRSILLVSKRSPADLRSVAVDTSSRTSVALLKVLFARHFSADPQFVPLPPDLEDMLENHDAALLIGDAALSIDPSDRRYLYFDLAEEWQRMTGLPFVFAFWTVRGAVRQQALAADASRVFHQSRDAGVAHAPQLAASEAPRYGISQELVLDYLTRHIDFSLDDSNLKGLSLFYQFAAGSGALPPAPELRFL